MFIAPFGGMYAIDMLRWFADLVTRDSMIGTGLALSPEEVPA